MVRLSHPPWFDHLNNETNNLIIFIFTHMTISLSTFARLHINIDDSLSLLVRCYLPLSKQQNTKRVSYFMPYALDCHLNRTLALIYRRCSNSHFIISKGESCLSQTPWDKKKLAQILQRQYNKQIHSFDLIDRTGTYRILTVSVINSFTLYRITINDSFVFKTLFSEKRMNHL
jgi:hypothetical protein